MSDVLEKTRFKTNELANTLPANSFALVPTTRDLEVIVDVKYYDQLRTIRWFALISPPDHIYAVADIEGKRVSLHQYVLSLASPDKAIEDIKHVTFHNKFSLDCVRSKSCSNSVAYDLAKVLQWNAPFAPRGAL